eukprot:CAMPEP_0182459430 /NCGR_PEP_ID=MMETSP1319-20130603/4560_1 /TAXON_ID=172717 /ORGANISM="Bolidomonas pacifica, Strain RCC208" /LENGTH=711 /DNA_ID=CAMNT_0024658351 /DNA_START=167 /DNA_END=2299 /DNA_ORIENTATION=-
MSDGATTTASTSTTATCNTTIANTVHSTPAIDDVTNSNPSPTPKVPGLNLLGMKSSLAKACLSSPPSQPLCIKLARAVTAHLSLLLDEASGNAGAVKESEATSSIETFHITLRAAFQSTLNASLKMWDDVKVYDVEDSLVKQARRSLMAIFVVLTRIMKDTPECFEGEEEQRKYLPLLSPLASALCNLGGSKGEGLIRLQDKHADFVRREVERMMKSKAPEVREEAARWRRMLGLQELWGPEGGPAQQMGGKDTTDEGKQARVKSESGADLDLMTSSDLKKVVKEEEKVSKAVKREKDGGLAQSSGVVGFGLKASSSSTSLGPVKEDTDVAPSPTSIFSHPKAVSLPVPLFGEATRLLGKILNFKPGLPTKVHYLSYYFLSLYMSYGTYVPSDVVELVTACYWCAAKSCDTAFRLPLLLSSPDFCEEVEKFRTLEATKSFGISPPSLEDWEREYGRDLPDSEAKPFVVIDGVVYKQERGRASSSAAPPQGGVTAARAAPQPVNRKKLGKPPYALPSQVTAYELGVLTLVGFDSYNLKSVLPLYYLPRLKLGLIESDVKKVLKSRDFLRSGLLSIHHPRECVAVAVTTMSNKPPAFADKAKVKLMRAVLDAFKKTGDEPFKAGGHAERAWGDLECFLREGKEAFRRRKEGRERESIAEAIGDGVPDDVKEELVQRRFKEKRKEASKKKKEKRKRSISGEEGNDTGQPGQKKA